MCVKRTYSQVHEKQVKTEKTPWTGGDQEDIMIKCNVYPGLDSGEEKIVE